jgi:hypothetical protein
MGVIMGCSGLSVCRISATFFVGYLLKNEKGANCLSKISPNPSGKTLTLALTQQIAGLYCFL